MNNKEHPADFEQNSDIVDLTLKTYTEGFDKYQESTPTEVKDGAKEWMDTFASYLPENGTILEFGSATGRDARYFALNGYRVTCTDIIPEALEKLSKEGFDVEEYDFRDEPKEKWINNFDGFFANGVLLHVPDNIFERVLMNIAKVLKNDGVAAFSLKNGEGEEITEEKMNSPRYFNYHNEEKIKNILSKLPFEIISMNPVENGKWICVIVRLKNNNSGELIKRSIDK